MARILHFLWDMPIRRILLLILLSVVCTLEKTPAFASDSDRDTKWEKVFKAIEDHPIENYFAMEKFFALAPTPLTKDDFIVFNFSEELHWAWTYHGLYVLTNNGVGEDSPFNPQKFSQSQIQQLISKLPANRLVYVSRLDPTLAPLEMFRQGLNEPLETEEGKTTVRFFNPHRITEIGQFSSALISHAEKTSKLGRSSLKERVKTAGVYISGSAILVGYSFLMHVPGTFEPLIMTAGGLAGLRIQTKSDARDPEKYHSPKRRFIAMVAGATVAHAGLATCRAVLQHLGVFN